MDIQLRDIHYSLVHSASTDAFTAELYIDGKHSGNAFNSGGGEKTTVEPLTPADQRLILQAEAFCRTMPPRVTKPGNHDTKETTVPMTLDLLIDLMVDRHIGETELARHQETVQRLMENAIVLQQPGDTTVKSFSFSLSLTVMLQSHRDYLQQVITDEVLPLLGGGYLIINNNINPSQLEAFGVTANQLKPMPVVALQKKRKLAAKTGSPKAKQRPKKYPPGK